MPSRVRAARIGLAIPAILVGAMLANAGLAQRRPIAGGSHAIHDATGLEFQLPSGFTREESTDPKEKRQSYASSGHVFQVELLPHHAESMEKVLEGIRTEFSCAFRLERLGRVGPLLIAITARTEVAAAGFEDTDLADLVVMVGEDFVRLVIYATKGHSEKAVAIADWISFTLRTSGEDGLDDALERRESDPKTGLSWRAPRMMRRESADGVLARYVSGDDTEIILQFSKAKTLKRALGVRGMRKSFVTTANAHGLEFHRRSRGTKGGASMKAAFRPRADGPYMILSIRRRADDHLARRCAAFFIASLMPIDLTRAELDSVKRAEHLRRSLKFEEGAAVERTVTELAELGFMPSATDALLEVFLRLEPGARAIAARAIRADTTDRVKRVLLLLRHRSVVGDGPVQAALLGSLSTLEDPDLLKWVARQIKGADPPVVNAMARLLACAPADPDRALRLLVNALARLEKRSHKSPDRIDADGTATALRAALAHLTGLRFTNAEAARAWMRTRPKK